VTRFRLAAAASQIAPILGEGDGQGQGEGGETDALTHSGRDVVRRSVDPYVKPARTFSAASPRGNSSIGESERREEGGGEKRERERERESERGGGGSSTCSRWAMVRYIGRSRTTREIRALLRWSGKAATRSARSLARIWVDERDNRGTRIAICIIV